MGVVLAPTAGATPVAAPLGQQRAQPLAAHTILDGASHGWKGPDDLTNIGNELYVAFQNGVPSTGGSAGTPRDSTIVKFTREGAIKQTWPVTGKIDGLTADPAHNRVIATVNEDGNSSLYTVPNDGGKTPTHYTYDVNPLPHGGGTDAITIDGGEIYVVASAPSVATGPALYHLTLAHGVAHVADSPFSDSSPATLVNNGQNTPTTLALTDPDSSTVVPAQSPRFAGSLMLDAQGDQQAIFASHLGAPSQQLQVLNLSQSVDDTAFATSRAGTLLATDSAANSVVAVTGTLAPGTAYTAVTPGNANTPPTPTPANYLGSIDLQTGAVHPVTTTGQPFQPHGLLYLPPAASTITVGASPNAAVGVAGVLLYAVVDPNTTDGTVAFTDNGAPIPGCDTRPVTRGLATCVTTFTTPGAHPITATYSGNATQAGSAATTPLTVSINPTPLQLALGFLIHLAHQYHLLGL